MIKLFNISKSFGAIQAVIDASFEIGQGQAVALVGPSGSGKTTILRLIGGLDQPDKGQIFINGNLASAPEILIPPHARGLGVVFQKPCLWPHMTVKKNIAFGLSGWKQPDVNQRCKELIHFARLDGLDNRLPHQLSGGEAQRVALVRALAPNPMTLLLDEPFSNLDQELRKEMIALVSRIRAEKKVTMLIVSHDHQALDGLCTEVIVIRKGRIQDSGGSIASA